MNNKKKVFILLFPILLFVLVFTYYPFIKNIIYALFRVSTKGELKEFLGLKNFVDILKRPNFINALKHTLILAFINVPVTLIITVGLALLANKKRKLSPVYETMFALPMSISMSAACMIFKSMFSPSVGFINYFFGFKYGWFQSSETALASCLILTIWMGIGFDFLLILSAFREIPSSVIEATKVDGISPSRRLFKVMLPLISPTLLYVVCTNFVLAIMTSAPMIIILGMTPQASSAETIMSMMYQSGIGANNYSLAAVLSITAFAMALLFTILSFIFSKKKVHYQ